MKSSGFPITDLTRWNASGGIHDCSLEEAREYCRSLARKHYENFSVATFFLPRALRPHFFSLYAYCRWADDLGDEVAENAESLRLLDDWEAQLAALYSGEKPRHPVFLALGETVREFGIPQTIFSDLLSAFRQDRVIHEYATREDLLDYCRRSANPVGRLVLYLARTTDEESFRLSDSICTGLQLANFWQDVERDQREKGRIYIPREDRQRFRCPDEVFHVKRASTPEFQALLAEEVRWAEVFFEAGRPLISRVPKTFRLEVRLFHDGGRAILDAIRRQNFRIWEKRPEVGKFQKLRLLLRALLSRSAN